MTESLHHAYDTPSLSPVQFLLAVMHDDSVPLTLRLEAASKVAPYVGIQPKDREPVLTIRIGGIPPPTQEGLSFEEMMEHIKATDLDSLPICTRCGYRMFFPCSCDTHTMQ